jgi:hypothetical protein
MAFTTRWRWKAGASFSSSRFGISGQGHDPALRFFGCSTVSPHDFPALETLMKTAVKEKQKFERLVVPKEKLLEMFAVGFLSHVAAVSSSVNLTSI